MNEENTTLRVNLNLVSSLIIDNEIFVDKPSFKLTAKDKLYYSLIYLKSLKKILILNLENYG